MFFRNIRIWFERISCKSSCCVVYHNEEHINDQIGQTKVTKIKAISTSMITQSPLDEVQL